MTVRTYLQGFTATDPVAEPAAVAYDAEHRAILEYAEPDDRARKRIGLDTSWTEHREADWRGAVCHDTRGRRIGAAGVLFDPGRAIEMYTRLDPGSDDEAPCPACYDGIRSDLTPDGEEHLGLCDVCRGVGVVTIALARLYTAWASVTTAGERPAPRLDFGITQNSLARWYAERVRLRPQVRCVFMRGDGAVSLTDGRGIELMRFTGLRWGYGGEGPAGFAVLLADLGVEPSYEAALEFATQPHEPTALIVPAGGVR